MAIIHFLNVKEGDCSIIEHNSGHVTVIDVCNAKTPEPVMEALSAMFATAERGGIIGNFHQKKHPVNPISYMRDHGISSIFRYIQTHPDMDHMGGVKALFKTFSPWNFWDTDNAKKIPSSSWDGSPYSKEDWDFYKRLRDEKPQQDPKRLALLSGACGQFYNVGEDGSQGGDGLHVLAPTQDLVDAANKADDYNDCSYVLLYCEGKNRIVFGGDSHDDTWDYIIEKYGDDVTDIDLLIAPHHGRKSGRSYKFLDTLRPTLTFFGNASSEHLAYDAWRNRGLSIFTNNQANCMVVDAGKSPMILYVTHEHFARCVNSKTFYDNTIKAWYVYPIAKEFIQ